MDLHSGKRAGGWIAALRKESSPATRDLTGSGDEDAHFCKRIGCSGRLRYTGNEFLGKPKASSSSSHSPVTRVKKPLEVHQKKLPSKTGTSSSNPSSVSDNSEIQEVNTSARSRATLKSKSRDTKSNRGVSAAFTRTVEVASSNTKTRNTYGQKDAQNGRRRNTVENRSTEGERNSSAKGKKIIGTSYEENATNFTPYSGNGVSSLRTRRSISLRGNNPSRVQSTRVNHNLQQTESCLLSSEASSSNSTFDNGWHSSNASSSMIQVSSQDQLVSQDQWVSQFERRRSGPYNVDTIADVLLALERIDQQDEGSTYEQLLSLEVNSVLGGFNFYDDHRDMRLDIDNMSYEELLALEEQIGMVSTALSEDELSKSLRIITFQPLQPKISRMSCNWSLNDTKCSICQEEFIEGDEMGKLGCDHGYHAVCIKEWLRLKNWCPVCKASAKPSDSS